LLTKAAG